MIHHAHAFAPAAPAAPLTRTELRCGEHLLAYEIEDGWKLCRVQMYRPDGAEIDLTRAPLLYHKAREHATWHHIQKRVREYRSSGQAAEDRSARDESVDRAYNHPRNN